MRDMWFPRLYCIAWSSLCAPVIIIHPLRQRDAPTTVRHPRERTHGAEVCERTRMRKPQPAPELPEDVAEVLHDALEGRHRSAESYEEDVRDAFQALPKANIEAAAAVCHDMGNEAMKSERYQEAVDHYTSVLAAHPHDHEVLANRSLAYLHLRQGPEALQDAALCVNLKPNWAKGYYRMGCALEECKAYKEAASVFAKVVEMEPENAEASGRLMKAHR